ncbi:MAG: glycosyltransferase family 4 protein [Thermoproteota archaeon]
MQRKIRVVIYGGKVGKGEIALGGHLWLSKVAEELKYYKDIEVIRLPGPMVGKNRIKNIVNAYLEGLKVLRMKPDAIIIDAGKDGDAAMAFLHTFISRKSRVYFPFHHYEPMQVGKHSNLISYVFAKLLLIITNKLNEKLWREASALFVVSNTMKTEISRKLRISPDKLVLTSSSIEIYENTFSRTTKDIDFLCIGRIGKFSYLVDIWKGIRRIKPNANFHMAGIGRDDPIVNELENVGNFKHHGVVSEEEKVKLYKSSKVFIFPSVYEGFGIAVAEALSYGLPVVAWNLPVYDEIWGKSVALRRVRLGDYNSFAKEAVFTLENFEELAKEAKIASKKLKTSWKDVGRIVHDTLLEQFKKGMSSK